MHVVIIGYRASGKSTVAPALAKSAGWPLIDSDALVETNAGCSIAELFDRHGEAHFRDLEAVAIRQALASDVPVVLATGGGCVETESVRAELTADRQQGLVSVLYLAAPAAVLAGRLAASAGGRPSLTGASVDQEVAEVLARRTPWYEALADATVDATKPVDEVVAASQAIVENWIKTAP